MTNSMTCRICGAKHGEIMVRGIRDWEYGIPGQFDYVRCSSCGIVQIDPFPGLDDLQNAYDIDYHGHAGAAERGRLFQTLFALNDFFSMRSLQRHLQPGSAILDVGCGSGEFLTKLKALQPGSLEGIDFSAKAVAMARSRGIKVFQGVFAEFLSADETYDAIFMNNYLEHVLDPVAELLKARRLLKQNGMLLGEVPNFSSFDRFLFGKYWGGNHVPRHTFQFEPQTLTNLLERTGFGQISIKCLLNPSHLALSIQNYLQRNTFDLRHNPALDKGRAKGYYAPLLMGMLPVNVIPTLLQRSGSMHFTARINTRYSL
ncbi:MAG: class I SAM-dependent methyltransferase [Magnetococcales bacterium]|nr:class I SAM-dependent methyltransferase [Magnetococcales bacterium]